MKQIYLIDDNNKYMDTYLLENNSIYDGVNWIPLEHDYVEIPPPVCKSCEWTGTEWTIIEEAIEPPVSFTPDKQDKLNVELIKQNAELKAENP